MYLRKHRDVRRTANHSPGDWENLRGEKEGLPGLLHPVNSTQLEHPEGSGLRVSSSATGIAGRAPRGLFLLSLIAELARTAMSVTMCSWRTCFCGSPRPLPTSRPHPSRAKMTPSAGDLWEPCRGFCPTQSSKSQGELAANLFISFLEI